MGQWNITIQGTGLHHNQPPHHTKDADKMARKFVQDLREAGHKVEVACFTVGAMEQITREGEETLCNPGELKRAYRALHEAHGDPDSA